MFNVQLRTWLQELKKWRSKWISNHTEWRLINASRPGQATCLFKLDGRTAPLQFYYAFIAAIGILGEVKHIHQKSVIKILKIDATDATDEVEETLKAVSNGVECKVEKHGRAPGGQQVMRLPFQVRMLRDSSIWDHWRLDWATAGSG